MLNKKVLSEKYVMKLYSIFREKNWSLKEFGKHSVFDRFCSRLAELKNDEERDLIIELTNEFLWVKSNMYEEYLLVAFKKLFDSNDWKPDKNKNIYICPLLPERDFNKLKSSTHMLYLCQSILMRTYIEFQEDQIRICETPKVLKLDDHITKMDSLILIDDFIGSGETALECLKYLKFLKDIDKKIYVVSLVAQEGGINNIVKEKVSVFAAKIRKRAITDMYSEIEAKEKIEIMRKISKDLKAPQNMLLGYSDTESLVSMIKTPNNTFPVYWYEKNNFAPFVRKENVKVIRG